MYICFSVRGAKTTMCMYRTWASSRAMHIPRIVPTSFTTSLLLRVVLLDLGSSCGRGGDEDILRSFFFGEDSSSLSEFRPNGSRPLPK